MALAPLNITCMHAQTDAVALGISEDRRIELCNAMDDLLIKIQVDNTPFSTYIWQGIREMCNNDEEYTFCIVANTIALKNLKLKDYY